MSTFIAGFILFSIVAIVLVFGFLRNKKQKKDGLGCSGSCSGCTGCGL